MAVKKKMITCSKCGCELSFRELFETRPLCLCCYRNKEDKAAQNGERDWKYMTDNAME
jgi:hypothetical protein